MNIFIRSSRDPEKLQKTQRDRDPRLNRLI